MALDHSAVGFDDPTHIDPLDAILNDLAQELDADQSTFNEILQISTPQLGAANIANIRNAVDFFRCVQNNRVYDTVDFVDYLINVTDVLNYHTAMGTNRVPDQLIQYKQRLFNYKEELKTKEIYTDKNFVGRKDDIENILKVMTDEVHSCCGVCICGLGGMGKTSLAIEVCCRLKTMQRWRIVKIDLRERETLIDLLSLSLTELQETFSTTDTNDMKNKLMNAILSMPKRTVLLFDNVDGLLQEKNKRELPYILGFFDDLLQTLDDNKSKCWTKVMITSRQKLIPENRILFEMGRLKKVQKRMNDLVLEIELKPLEAQEAISLYDKCVHEENKPKSSRKVISDIVKFCGYCPMAIRSTCGAVNSGLDPEVIRYNLKIGYAKGGLTHALQVKNCLTQTFNSLDKKYKEIMIKLAIFQTAKFDDVAASVVLGEPQMYKTGERPLTMQTKMDLLALKSRHFVEIMDAEAYLQRSESIIDVFGKSELKYSLHPLVFMFLQELISAGGFPKQAQDAKKGFVQHFEDLLLKIGRQMDKNCMKAWKMIEENKKHIMNMLKGDTVENTDTSVDMQQRILLCTQMVLIGNLLLGDYHRINFIDKMYRSSLDRRSRLEMIFWKIEKANWFFDLDRNELVNKILSQILNNTDDLEAKGTAMAPVFGCLFFLKGKLKLRMKKPVDALEDLIMAKKLFNEHRFVRRNYLYHITNIYEKIAQAYQMFVPPDINNAINYLSAAYIKALEEEVENYNNLDIPSFIGGLGRCYYMLGLQEKGEGNKVDAKKLFEKSVAYYTKAMALDTQMNLHKYDNYAEKLVKRAESYVELGLLNVSGALSDAVKDIKEADELRRKILQPPNYKSTHTPYLVGKILCIKGKQEYEKKQKANALNHLWEGVMYFEITRDMIKIGGLHPLKLHEEEYREIRARHLWALQQTREKDKITAAIKFYNDFESGKFEEEAKKARSEKETIQNTEFIPIEDVKAEIMMSRPGETKLSTIIPESGSDDEESLGSHYVDSIPVVFKDYELKPEEKMDFDKLFQRMENPDAYSSSSDEDDKLMETSDEVKEVIDIQQDIFNTQSTVADENIDDDVFDSVENTTTDDNVTAKEHLSNIRQKSATSTSSTSSHGSIRRTISRGASMQMFLKQEYEKSSEKGNSILESTKSLSKDSSFDLEMPVIEYLSIVETDNKERKKQMLLKMHQTYTSVQEEDEEEMKIDDVHAIHATEEEQPYNVDNRARKRQLQATDSETIEEKSRLKTSKNITE